MPFWFDAGRVSESTGAITGVLPSRHGAREQRADGLLADTSRCGDIAVAEIVGAKREQQAVARGQPLERLTRGRQSSVLVRQLVRRDATVVIGRPRDKAKAPTLAIAGRVGRHREQPAPDVVEVPAAAKMPEQLQERLLNDILGILVMPEEHHREPVDGRAMLLEQPARHERRVCAGHHACRPRYNAGAGWFVTAYTSAITLAGLPLPLTIFSGAATTMAPVGGS